MTPAPPHRSPPASQAQPALRLASRSPRRAALLSEAGIAFRVGPLAEVSEQPPVGLDPAAVVQCLAERKARAVMAQVPGQWVLAADTLVFLEGEALGKPQDAADAIRMLRALSGREHEVLTGVALACWTDQGVWIRVGFRRTGVCFAVLDEARIREYVESGEPLDKAGAYALQGGAAAFVTQCKGRKDTVVGLPLDLVRELMALAAAQE